MLSCEFDSRPRHQFLEIDIPRLVNSGQLAPLLPRFLKIGWSVAPLVSQNKTCRAHSPRYKLTHQKRNFDGAPLLLLLLLLIR